ncbi:alpha/beta hydrolase [Prochlorococcus marinus XMU1406]|uniref:alpha/beta hydrolase n=1 Tax=Prochlorococcus marinus TaxID=1219 RepID=UPI001ADB9153|nr:alpha/beta hydrolase [Prochlorococcus marinus]MBO8207307.1 alpha/beta hydrolase [Prochlorococcus marinus XMU1406]MCR8543122.1 alpha/beta hydrolase [Prochlorococcus marinus XMU1427]
MKFSKFLIFKIFFILASSPFFFNVPKANAAEEIKITYSIFSRTIKLNSLKSFAKGGKSTRKLKKILKSTGSPNKEIREVLNKDFEVPITIASKLVYSEIGNVFLTRLSSIIHPPRANDDRTGMLALRASVIQGINLGNGKINLINFFEAYPTKTVILDVSALSKVMNKVESISELLTFFTNSPLEKIKEN